MDVNTEIGGPRYYIQEEEDRVNTERRRTALIERAEGGRREWADMHTARRSSVSPEE